jgi:large subunit ribosomal protein L25
LEEVKVIFTIEAQKRTNTKHSELTALRQQGLIPAVIYGKDLESTPIAIKRNDFLKCYKKSFQELSFYEIILNGKKYHTILKDKQIHPVSRDFLHLDFMLVQATAIMEFEIPLQFIGEPIGVKNGGLLETLQRTVKISCKAEDAPEEIPIDISDLQIGDSLHIKDLPQGNWQYKDSPDTALVVVLAPKVEVAEAPEEAAEVRVEENTE